MRRSGTPGFELQSKRGRQSNSRPRWQQGDVVRLKTGEVVELTRVVVRDWTTEFYSGKRVLTGKQIEGRA